ncbi:hypothetical protein N656DRAFT_768403 [Canariomyces notabilis]|uniref:Uncharacterized protein n=1 Tax=Canariomyces notabilis TaxID=2074819 RepID=A0AAN6YTR7_9PEZI|nr:hypothetical protein N656DRAFT_768403 [Canariomyces arenarius]
MSSSFAGQNAGGSGGDGDDSSPKRKATDNPGDSQGNVKRTGHLEGHHVGQLPLSAFIAQAAACASPSQLVSPPIVPYSLRSELREAFRVELKAYRQHFEAATAAIMEEIRTLQGRVEAGRAELAMLQLERDIAKDDAHASGERARYAEEQVRVLDDKLRTADAKLRAAGERLGASEDGEKKLQEKLQVSQEKLRATEEKLRASEEIYKKKAMLAEEETRVAKEETRVAKNETRVAMEKARVAEGDTLTLKLEAQKADVLLSESAELVEGFKDQIKTLKEARESGLNAQSAAEKRMRGAQDRARAAKEQLESSKSEILDLRSQLQAAKVACHATERQLGGEIQSLKRTLNRVESEADGYRDELRKMVAMNDSLKTSLEEQKKRAKEFALPPEMLDDSDMFRRPTPKRPRRDISLEVHPSWKSFAILLYHNLMDIPVSPNGEYSDKEIEAHILEAAASEQAMQRLLELCKAPPWRVDGKWYCFRTAVLNGTWKSCPSHPVPTPCTRHSNCLQIMRQPSGHVTFKELGLKVREESGYLHITALIAKEMSAYPKD